MCGHLILDKFKTMKKVIISFSFLLSCTVFSQTTNEKEEALPFAWNSDSFQLKEYISPFALNKPNFQEEFEVTTQEEKKEESSMPIYDIQVLDPKMKTNLPEGIPQQSLQIIKPTASK